MLEVFTQVAERAQYKTNVRYDGNIAVDKHLFLSRVPLGTREGKVKLFLNPVVELRTSLY